ncbi:hypothetical protein POVCU1_019290 [Plasmodium ovale curtisi]|uniref:Uncharacterized protein n=1 Tax=Plasmodium ovale curtisi TaxID=864141 RepID=A0A1A8WI31_PLAOA|nr:hypothetical protein POVCU1_019290 [Plasmodium ovale curtisi]
MIKRRTEEGGKKKKNMHKTNRAATNQKNNNIAMLFISNLLKGEQEQKAGSSARWECPHTHIFVGAWTMEIPERPLEQYDRN